MDKKLSIVIPVYNKWNFTKSCLKDLNQLPSDHEIIIIDNASTDETQKEMIELERSLEMKDKLIYVRNEENTFHSKACNQGFQRSASEYVIFLNNDIRVKNNHSSWTKTIMEACDRTQGLVGPTMGQLDENLNFVREENKQLAGNSYLGGWCIAGRKDIWNKLRMRSEGQAEIWNEEFPFYFNDTDLSFRARKLGVPLTVIDLPDIVHFGKVSAAQINIPKLYKEGRNVFLQKWGKTNR